MRCYCLAAEAQQAPAEPLCMLAGAEAAELRGLIAAASSSRAAEGQPSLSLLQGFTQQHYVAVHAKALASAQAESPSVLAYALPSAEQSKLHALETLAGGH